MIKVSFFYPNNEGSRFDHEYYETEHLELAKRLLGPALRQASLDHGLSGIEPGSAAPFHATGHLYFDSVESFYEAIMPHVEVLKNDVSNYSDTEAVIQISRVAIRETY